MKNTFKSSWRPLTAYVYMAICICDFIIFPILWSILQASFGGSIIAPWVPITLQGGGLIHLSFGGAITVAAHARTKEKMNGVQDNEG